MNYWKLGCRWYSNAPLFFNFLLENKIVISWTNKKYQINDIILLTDGFTAIGIAKVLSPPSSIVELPQFHDAFKGLKIPISEKDLVVFKADIFELKKSEQFTYQLQQGICQIQANNIQIKTQELYRSKESQVNMENLKFLLEFKKQIILQGPPGTGKTREAKEIAKAILGVKEDKELENSEQFKLIQFHPSYTYEDFVRGIVAKPNPDGEGILYEAENKTLGYLAKKALDNYQAVHTQTEPQSGEAFEDFIFQIRNIIEEEGQYQLTDEVYLFFVDERRFKYKGDNWKVHSNGLNINFSEFRKVIYSEPSTRQDIVQNKNLNSLTRHHATYFLKLYNDYLSFVEQKKDDTKGETVLKYYVLIIDEINRANLSSVLGELIYALEYRGEEVESMYEVEGAQKLILPPNLYIIGTMNTADRSVGHIDYAIRRRFAFVDVLPKDLTNDDNISFDSSLFNEVKALFTSDDYQTRSKHLSNEFEPKDVALGHSYFIDKAKDGGSMSVRLEYEIKPILLEYVKDGVLIGDDIKQKIENLKSSI